MINNSDNNDNNVGPDQICQQLQGLKSPQRGLDTGATSAPSIAGKNATLGNVPFAKTFEAADDEGLRHSRWRDNFQQLCEYKVQFGHCIVPQPYYSANPKLGKWVRYQRSRYWKHTKEKQTSMTAERIRALEGIGFDWGKRNVNLASVWSERFQQMCDFKAQFGHCIVPHKYSANLTLGRWVTTQRHNYKLHQKGNPSHLTEERIRALQSVGFERATNTAFWNVRLDQLRDFKAQFGHCLVPHRYAANPKLGHWVSNLRHNCKLYQEGKPSRMTAERIRKLEGIEFF